MKIRINDNSVRYRLSKSEVDEICNIGLITSTINFGTNTLTYTLEARSNINQLEVDYDCNCIAILIPIKFTENWDTNDIVGFENLMAISENESLKILVEKDFKCLDNTDEDQSDNFENPNAVC